MTAPPPPPLEHHRAQAREHLRAVNEMAKNVLDKPDMYGYEMLCVYVPIHDLLWHLIKTIVAANWPNSLYDGLTPYPLTGK